MIDTTKFFRHKTSVKILLSRDLAMKISSLSAIHIIFNLHVKKFPLDF